ncbi:DMT family transporter [Thalassovita sp.]|jgi:drug/metabolite transporter (DMT)-like permease|uniref:DMT family transporter n=1 Tax=Thalassovita sp. TaxID=1979401 RepID=UPI0029DE6C69|nr:DMT family transporter [Thalassovita sp.]
MNNIRGILLVVLSMAAFATEDMFVKAMTQSLPTGQVIFMLGAGGALVFAVLAKRHGHALFTPLLRNRALLVRTVAEAFAALFFITSLALVPMSTVAAVFQATPLAITLGAALFLGEQVGWRRWSAILVGFAGVLTIIRPGMAGFDPAVLMVLGAVAAIATRDLVSRRLPPDMSTYVVSFHGFGSLAVVGPLLMLAGADMPRALSLTASGQLAAALVFGVLGYIAIVTATRTGDASAITPFRYTRLIFSMILGMLVFSEQPDLLTYVGSALIIASGLYTYLRERRLLVQAAPAVSSAAIHPR